MSQDLTPRDEIDEYEGILVSIADGKATLICERHCLCHESGQPALVDAAITAQTRIIGDPHQFDVVQMKATLLDRERCSGFEKLAAQMIQKLDKSAAQLIEKLSRNPPTPR